MCSTCHVSRCRGSVAADAELLTRLLRGSWGEARSLSGARTAPGRPWRVVRPGAGFLRVRLRAPHVHGAGGVARPPRCGRARVVWALRVRGAGTSPSARLPGGLAQGALWRPPPRLPVRAGLPFRRRPSSSVPCTGAVGLLGSWSLENFLVEPKPISLYFLPLATESCAAATLNVPPPSST